MWNVINLLRFIAAIVIVDIVIRIWFSSGLNLVFSSTEFNNIITPLATIIAVVIYYSALRNSKHQNNMLMSQNIKPYYDDKLKKILDSAEDSENRIRIDYSVEDESPFGESEKQTKEFKLIERVGLQTKVNF